MDPVSAAASITGLITLADVVVRRGYRIFKQIRGADQAIAALLSEVTKLIGTLRRVEYTAELFQEKEDRLEVSLHEYTQPCYAILREIQVRLQEGDLPEPGSMRALKQKLLWPLTESKTNELTQRLQRYIANLNMAFNADGWLNLMTASKKHTDSISKLTDVLQALNLNMLSRERRRIFDSLGAVDPRKSQKIGEDIRMSLAAPTGVWFTEGMDFKNWLEEDKSKLWLFGIAGAGKTVLTTAIVQAIQSAIRDEPGIHAALAYFYCDYKDVATQDPWNIIGSLVKQLALQNSQSFKDLEAFYEEHNGQDTSTKFTTTEELCGLLQRMASRFDGNVMIVIDALDEIEMGCSEAVELIHGLNSAESPQKSPIKTLFTSRREVEIERNLSDYRKCSIEADGSDVRLFVSSRIEYYVKRGVLWFRDPGLKEEILETLVIRAQGMFRWVACQIDHLCALSNDSERRRALTQLPPDLPGTYERILARIAPQQQNLAKKTLQWITFAQGPLSTSALLEALAVSDGDENLDEGALSREDDLLRWCSSLLRCTTESGTLELAHFSVKEYLLSKALKDSRTVGSYWLDTDESNVYLAKTCLTYLNFETFREGPCDTTNGLRERLEHNAFFQYACTYWDYHAYGHFENTYITEQSRLLFSLSAGGQFRSYNQCLLVDDSMLDQGRGEYAFGHAIMGAFASAIDRDKITEPTSDPHAGSWGDPESESESDSSNSDIKLGSAPDTDSDGDEEAEKRKDEMYSHYAYLRLMNTTPLQWASALALHELCGWLLITSDPNRSYVWSTPLAFAIAGGFPISKDCTIRLSAHEMAGRRIEGKFKTIESLLDAGARVDEEFSDQDLSILSLALRANGEEGASIVRLLLSRGAIITLSTIKAAERLINAASVKVPLAVQALLESRADGTIDKTCENALHSLQARVKGIPDQQLGELIAKDSVLSIEEKDLLEATIEHAARFGSNSDLDTIMEKLQGSSGHGQLSDRLSRSLYLAIYFGVVKVVSAFLKCNVTINNQTLSAVIGNAESTEIMDLMLKHGCKFTVQHLKEAVCLGRLEVVVAIVEQGVDVASTDEKGDLPLHHALRKDENAKEAFLRNQSAIARLLLDRGASSIIPDSSGDTPLHLAARAGLDEIVVLLLDKNVPCDIQNNNGHRPLAAATVFDSHRCLSRLLEAGAQLDAKSRDFQVTATLCAAVHGATQCLRLLADAGADLELADNEGLTPLLKSATSLKWEAARLLIEAGSSVVKTDSNGCTVLHLAAGSDDTETVELLLRHNLDLELQDNEGKTALMHAAASGNSKNVICLLGADAQLGAKQDGVGSTPLHFAIDNGSKDCVRALIDAGSDLESVNAVLETPIMAAAYAKRWEIVELLLHADVRVNCKSGKPHGMTALHCAARAEKPTIVKRLLEKGADVSATTSDYRCTPLTYASEAGDLASVRLLLEHGADITTREGPPQGNTAFLWAAANGHCDVVELLLTKGADISDATLDEGVTALMRAIVNGHRNMVKLLLEKGINVNRKSKKGDCALLTAIDEGNTEMVRLIINNRADLTATCSDGMAIAHHVARANAAKILPLIWNLDVDWNLAGKARFEFEDMEGEGVHPLHLAAKDGLDELIENLFKRKLVCNPQPCCGHGFTPLHWAARAGNVAAAEMLIEWGAEIDLTTTDKKRTALHLAAMSGDLKTILMLLRRGASVSVEDSGKCTPDMLAIDDATARLLRRKGHEIASPSPQTGSDYARIRSPSLQGSDTLSNQLLAACETGNVRYCQNLLLKGADIEGGPDAKCSPLLKALYKGHEELVRFLLHMGADVHRSTCAKRISRGYQAVHVAVWHGHYELLQIMLAKNPRLSDFGLEPVHIAAIQGRDDCLQALLDYENRMNNGNIRRALDCQVRLDSCDKRILFDEVPSGPIWTIRDRRSGTPLHLAALAGCLSTAKLLLEKGANPSLPDSYGRLPLHGAAFQGRIPMMKLLLHQDATINTPDALGFTPLMAATSGGSDEVANKLLSLGADTLARDREGSNCMHIAASKGFHGIIAKFNEIGMDPSTQNALGETVLHAALTEGSPEMIQFVLDKALVPDVGTPTYGNLLNVAATYATTAVVKKLLLRMPEDARVEYVNNHCSRTGTPMYSACYRGDIAMIETLLEAGASLDPLGGPFGTPFNAACAMNRGQAVRYLLRHGAKPVPATSDHNSPATVEVAARHGDILHVLQSFEEHGMAGLEESMESSSGDAEPAKEKGHTSQSDLSMSDTTPLRPLSAKIGPDASPGGEFGIGIDTPLNSLGSSQQPTLPTMLGPSPIAPPRSTGGIISMTSTIPTVLVQDSSQLPDQSSRSGENGLSDEHLIPARSAESSGRPRADSKQGQLAVPRLPLSPVANGAKRR